VDHPRDRRAGAGPALSRSARAARALARWLRPPRTLRPTRAGWAFFAITFGVGFAALNTGNNLLYLVLSLMLAFLVLSGVLSESALRGISVRRRVPRELFAAAPASVGLEIHNRQRRVPSFAVVVEDRVRDAGGVTRAAGRVFALRIGPEASELRAYPYAPAQRGEILFEGFQVATRFPFGLFSKALVLESPEPALVYPAVEPLAASDAGGAPRGDGAGDAQRRIHWPASLRRAELLVRQVESERVPEVEVRLRTSRCAPGERFERAVCWAASEVVALLDAGSRVALRTDATWIPPAAGARQRGRLLGFLARVAPDAAEPA
jgi:uncharacterized protein (DUF58 family)